jgi:hypothetical protein
MTLHPSQQQAQHASTSPTTVPCTCLTRSQQQQQATPAAASPTPSTLWLPLHEAQEMWASFGKQATITHALIATGHAFLALSWEQSALRHYQQAMQQQRLGYTRAMDCSLEECLRNLDAAMHHWHPSYSQLERLINHATLCDGDQERETIRDLLMAIASFQRRLGSLYEQVAQEREAFVSYAHEQSRLRASEVRP